MKRKNNVVLISFALILTSCVNNNAYLLYLQGEENLLKTKMIIEYDIFHGDYLYLLSYNVSIKNYYKYDENTFDENNMFLIKIESNTNNEIYFKDSYVENETICFLFTDTKNYGDWNQGAPGENKYYYNYFFILFEKEKSNNVEYIKYELSFEDENYIEITKI